MFFTEFLLLNVCSTTRTGLKSRLIVKRDCSPRHLFLKNILSIDLGTFGWYNIRSDGIAPGSSSPLLYLSVHKINICTLAVKSWRFYMRCKNVGHAAAFTVKVLILLVEFVRFSFRVSGNVKLDFAISGATKTPEQLFVSDLKCETENGPSPGIFEFARLPLEIFDFYINFKSLKSTKIDWLAGGRTLMHPG